MAAKSEINSDISWSWIFGILFFVLVGVSLVLLSSTLDGQSHYPTVSRVSQAVGIGLITSAMLGGMTEIVLRRQMLSDFSENTGSLLNAFFDRTFKSSVKYGFVGISDDLNAKEFFESAKQNDEIVWLDTYAPGHQALLDVIEQKAREGVTFKFLVLEPGCSMAELRRTEIGGRFEQAFETELEIFLRDLNSLAAQEYGEFGGVEVKTYSDLLANPFYLLRRNGKPEKAISSYYLRKATGVDFPHFEWRKGNKAFINGLSEYFDWKWKRSDNTPSSMVGETDAAA